MQPVLHIMLWLAHVAIAQPQGYDNLVRVKAGESIQKAIDAAKPGSQIVVECGTYAEQLTINKNGISLVGEDATLVPPTKSVQNTCTGLVGGATNAGICVTGTGVTFAGPFQQEHRPVASVAQRVKDVTISGFTVKGFDGLNIGVIGADCAVVKSNTLVNGPAYGVLSHFSLGSRIIDNNVVSESTLRSIGICTDDKSPSQVRRNRVSGYSVGLCVETRGADYVNNKITGACAGVFVDPGISAQVLYNEIGANDPRCLTSFGFVSGIILYGSTNTQVKFNIIHDQHASGLAAGISLVDATQSSPVVLASGDILAKNTLDKNDFDIYVNTTGTGNVVRMNTCTTPANLCTT